MIDKSDFSSKKQDDLSWITEISKESLITVLIQKNILQANDLIETERHSRAHPSKKTYSTHHHHSSPFKRFASHHKWTRQITGRLFGWEWKKVKTSSQTHQDHY